MTESLALEAASFEFPGGRRVFSNFTARFHQNEITILLGPSGCGKSTLLRLLAGLLPLSSGSLRASDSIAMVFQEPRLLPWRTVAENILLPWELRSHTSRERPDVAALLRRVQLEKSEALYPHQLSGGMKQRVAIARALSLAPEWLLLDEPFSALDEATREDLQELLLTLRGQTSLIFVTHSLAEAVYLGDRLLMLNPHGQLILDQPLRDSFSERDRRQDPAVHARIAELSVLLRKARNERTSP